MVPDVTIPVERFHRVLIDEIQKQRPTYLGDSFTVAEIYQILVPYRSHRDALGVEMNGDYEDALLRLLAGAGDFVVLESDDARTRILRELQSKNPNTGLFREFAGAGVHLNPESLPEAMRAEANAEKSGENSMPAEWTPVEPPKAEPPAAASSPNDQPDGFVAGQIKPAVGAAPDIAAEAKPAAGLQATYFDFETTSIDGIEAEVEASVVEGKQEAVQGEKNSGPTAIVNGAAKPEEDSETARPISLVSATESTSAEPGAGFWKPGEHPVSTTTTAPTTTAQASAAVAGADCNWCDEQLPHRDDVHYCPFCGMSTSTQPCSSCKAEMDASWKFCVSCGHQSGAS